MPDPAELPSVVAAERWHPIIGVAAWTCLAAGLLALAAGLLLPLAGIALDPDLSTLLGLAAGGAGAAAAGLLPAWLMTGARSHLAEAVRASRLAPASGALFGGAAAGGAAPVADAEAARLVRLAGWPQALSSLPGALLAVIAPLLLRPATGGDSLELSGGIAALILAFPVLVLERRCAAAVASELPEGRGLASLLRLLLWTLVGGGVAALLASAGLGLGPWIAWPLAILIALTGLELLLRAAAVPFLPVAGAHEARGLGDSLVAGLVLARLDPVRGLGGGLKDRFGVDLSQSWALAFTMRAALPVAAALLLAAWLLTGVTALRVAERGVYERLGAPVAVLAPGLHVHLPWPFGRVHRLEFGMVHEISLGGDESAVPAIAAGDQPPAEYDRLWEKPHPTEGVLLIPARGAAAGQGFQLLSSDVRVCWRLGLSDADARRAAYGAADPAGLVKAEANRVLLRAVADRTLDAVIAADRSALAEACRRALQAELDARACGIEVVAVVVDAIHPPTGAAAAFHGVQAAGIAALAEVATARSYAAKAGAEAAGQAAGTAAAGTAAAAEAMARASAERERFAADAAAWARHGAALGVERWLQALAKSLPRAQAVIIDHRLPLDGGATIDLRRFAPEDSKK